MRYERLHKLGKEKFARIVNELVRGAPPTLVARLIQQDWGESRDVAEHTLIKQLTRLRDDLKGGAYGSDLADLTQQSALAKIQRLRGTSGNTLDLLMEAIEHQRLRMKRFLAIEAAQQKAIPELNRLMRIYVNMLVAAQEMRFNLGYDPYLRGTNPPPDAHSAGQKYSDAVAEAERILDQVQGSKPS